MDEFLDYFLSSSSWSEGNATERLSWVGNEPVQTNGLLPGSMRADMGDENNSSISMIPSSHMIESLVTQGSSMLVGGDVQPKQEGLDCGSKPSFPGVADSNSKAGYMSLQLNTNSLTQGTLNHCSPELLSTVSGSAKSPRAPPESGSVGSNDSEPSGFQPSLLDSQSLTSIPQLWPPPSYEGVSCLSSVMGQDKLQGFGLQGEYLDTNATNVLGNRYLGDDKILQIGNLPASLSVDEQDMLNNQCLSTFAPGHHIPLARTAGLHSQLQLLQSNEGNLIKHYTDQFPVSQLPQVPATSSGGCNGAAKPRVRARRGQATDPHSIAERLRREKIAERMKNLQELVPNSNKSDKASMLDEIIEYVKFLQLQVKVLSMSRLGATGAVVPLITDSQAEGSNGLLLSPSAAQGADPFESPDNIAFEQEVVKLMESNVNTAMQFLQSKGLCLMPIALATAISGRKASSGPVSADKKKLILTHALVHQNHGPPPPGIGISSYGENFGDKNLTGIHNGEDSRISGCNGTVIKQEEVKNTICSSSELKPKT